MLDYLFYFCEEKIQNKFLLASIKSLATCENTSSNPLQEARSGFAI
jgi:hypothetical protein